MTEREALIGLNLIGDIGSIRLKSLLERFGSPQEILLTREACLTDVFGIGQSIARRIRSIRREDIDRERALAVEQKVRIITQLDADYPHNLRHIPDPPIVLYVKGTLRNEDSLSIAVVGSRRASYYGLSLAEKFSSELSLKGFTIVSGLARGIDTSAHRGALKYKQRTIAVLGSGLRHIYPPENKTLAEEIAQQGAVISEFPFDAKPLRQHFPRRNRIISGLALGVLVVEAARNSGALITADAAMEQGREVFAIPGKVGCSTSFGTHGLIQQGAKLTSCIDDIIEELNLDSLRAPCKRRATADAGHTLRPQEEGLYGVLSDTPLSLDELVEKTHFDVTQLSTLLFRLQLERLVIQLPGKQFVRRVSRDTR